ARCADRRDRLEPDHVVARAAVVLLPRAHRRPRRSGDGAVVDAGSGVARARAQRRDSGRRRARDRVLLGPSSPRRHLLGVRARDAGRREPRLPARPDRLRNLGLVHPRGERRAEDDGRHHARTRRERPPGGVRPHPGLGRRRGRACDRRRHVRGRLADHADARPAAVQDRAAGGLRRPDDGRGDDLPRHALRVPALDDARDLWLRTGGGSDEEPLGGALGRGREHRFCLDPDDPRIRPRRGGLLLAHCGNLRNMSDGALDELHQRLAIATDLAKVQMLLFWDQRTMMPPAGATGRADQLATITRLLHERWTDERLGELLDELGPYGESLDYDSDDAALIRFAAREHDKARRVPPALRAEMTRAASLALPVWEQARRESDWALFAPCLEHNLDLRREYVACFDGLEEPYDALLDEYEPGMKTSEVRTVFEQIKDELVELIADVREHELDTSFLSGSFPVERQW